MDLLFIGLAIGAICAGITAWFIAKQKYKSEGGISQEDMGDIIRLNREVAGKESEIKSMTERLENQKKEIESINEKFKTEFENLANAILDKKSAKFVEQNKASLDVILNPLKEKIKEFENTVKDTYVKGTKERSALVEQIKNLAELNRKMSEDASNLTKALKGDTKTQGDWGELRLELILEKAGLQKNIHYTIQKGFRDEDGVMKKPDFIIQLPDSKHLIIDSKVSLTAYEAYFNSDDEAEEKQHLKDHIASIKNHIRELGAKNYQTLYQINSPDFVLMYVPIEPAFTLALQNDETLYLDALDRNIVLVTTSTLLATMSTVSSIWKQEDSKKNILEIKRQSESLYEKFVGFTEDLVNVGNRMNSAKNAYDSAMNKLSAGSGNLVRRVENIRKLGLEPSKSIAKPLLDKSDESDGNG